MNSTGSIALARHSRWEAREWRYALLVIPSLVLISIVFLMPLVLFFSYSLQAFVGDRIVPGWTLATYAKFLRDPFYWQTVGNSLRLAMLVTALTLLAAYPAAFMMARMPQSSLRLVIGLAVFSPLLVSIVVRAYGWLLVLSETGVVNFVITRLGITQEPVRLIFNWTGVVISMVHIEMPFMFFPILTVLLQLPKNIEEAAQDLGADGLQTWRRVILPLSLPGVLAGCQIVFTTSLSAFASPTLLGGGRVRVLPVMIYQNIVGLNWPMGAVQSVVLLVLSLILVAVFSRVLQAPISRTGRGL